MHQAKLRKTLQWLMDAKALSATRLADLAGVSQPTISRFLKGDTDTMELETLLPLAQVLNVTVSQLIGETPIDENEARQNAYMLLQQLAPYQVPAAVKILDALTQPPPKRAKGE